MLRFTTSGGAGESGLARLVHLQFLTAAGDAAVAVSLAGTLFFTLPTDQARPQVAQFLLLTMAPFAAVAPFIGPFLDRYQHGRRWAIGVTLALRGFPVLGVGRRDRRSLGLGLFPVRAGLSRRIQSLHRDPRFRRAAPAAGRDSPWSTPTPGSPWPMSLARRSAIAAGIARGGSEWSLRFGFVNLHRRDRAGHPAVPPRWTPPTVSATSACAAAAPARVRAAGPADGGSNADR